MKLRTRPAILAILAVLVGGVLVFEACSPPPPPVSGIVVGKDTHRHLCGVKRKRFCTDYDVTLKTPEGQLVTREVSGGTYDRLKVGQRVDRLVR